MRLRDLLHCGETYVRVMFWLSGGAVRIIILHETR